MVLTKRKLRPDGFQTVEPPGSLAMPTYSCFSNSCALTDCEMYKWDVHGPRQNSIPKLGLLRDIQTLIHATSNWPLSFTSISFRVPFFFLLSLCICKTQFFFNSTLQRKKLLLPLQVFILEGKERRFLLLGNRLTWTLLVSSDWMENFYTSKGRI